MAVIDVELEDLEDLVGRSLTEEELEEEGSMLGVLFESQGEGILEVEVEPNRPDLLSAEGVSRALKGFFGVETGAVDYVVEDGDVEVEVKDSVQDVREHITCARVTGLDLDETSLESIIQLQEKLTYTYGRKREKIAIGLHDFGDVKPPVTYRAAKPGEVSFVPLGSEEEMDLGEILENHDKGKEYGWILEGKDRYPVIEDSEGQVLSFPPVINGTVTEVTEGTEDLFIDVTGTSRQEVETALNILVAALHERGGEIESVSVDGERMPDMGGELVEVDPDYLREVSGLQELSDSGIVECLEKMRFDAYEDGRVQVEVPSYRADIMHPYDLIEDVVIAYGYDNVQEEIPEISAVGGEDDETVFVDRIREFMVGAGAQECMTFILSNREKLFERMDLEEEDLVSMSNPLTEDYAVVRNWLLPSLMETLSNNQHNRYPQNIFEVGTCSVPSENSPTGASDVKKLAYVSAHSGSAFSHVRGILQSLAKVLDLSVEVEREEHPSFVEKRCGTVIFDGEAAGFIGEMKEEVLERWQVEVPATGFELDLEKVRQILD